MKIATAVPLVGGLAVGYVLGTAAGRARFQQIRTTATELAHHPHVQQTLFDLAGQARSNAQHLPGPAASLVNQVATRLQDRLTQPDSTPAAPTRTRPGFPATRNLQSPKHDDKVSRPKPVSDCGPGVG